MRSTRIAAHIERINIERALNGERRTREEVEEFEKIARNLENAFVDADAYKSDGEEPESEQPLEKEAIDMLLKLPLFICFRVLLAVIAMQRTRNIQRLLITIIQLVYVIY